MYFKCLILFASIQQILLVIVCMWSLTREKFSCMEKEILSFKSPLSSTGLSVIKVLDLCNSNNSNVTQQVLVCVTQQFWGEVTCQKNV